MDYGKWKYKQQKKKEQKTHAAHVMQLKELRIKSVCGLDDHDQNPRQDEPGQKILRGRAQGSVQYYVPRPRNAACRSGPQSYMEKFKADLAELSKPEREPKLGKEKRMIMILTPQGMFHQPA